jgi:UPF0755 protein
MKPVIGFLFTIVVASILGIYLLIIYWPQDSRLDQVKVQIPKGATLEEISQIFLNEGIISNEKTFTLATRLVGHNKDLPAGIFSIRASGSNYSIIRQLIHGSPEVIKVTLLEGWTMEQVTKRLSELLQISEKKLLKLCNDDQFVKKLGLKSVSLVGYLFPETYYFFEGVDPETVLREITGQYLSFMNDSLINRGKELGLSELEIMTLASIVEGEAMHDNERPIISAVYHNRIKRGMRLQADPTIQFIIDDGPRKLFSKDLKIKHPYNTYIHDGLPPGPINNPGKASILAVLYPDANDFLYFVARGDGYHTFSRTQEEHNNAKRNIRISQRNS